MKLQSKVVLAGLHPAGEGVEAEFRFQNPALPAPRVPGGPRPPQPRTTPGRGFRLALTPQQIQEITAAHINQPFTLELTLDK